MDKYLLKKLSECKLGTKVKVFYGGKDYICEIEDITFEYFRTNYIKEHECQFKLYFNEYGTYWKLLDDNNEEIVSESLKALKRLEQETCPATYMPDFDKKKCIEIIANDLDKLERMEKAFDELVKMKPVMNANFSPEAGGDNINYFIKKITEYIIRLSSIDNIIISAVYEKYKREHEKDLEVLEILKNESDEKKIIERDGIVSFHLNMILTKDNYEIIKEWLER